MTLRLVALGAVVLAAASVLLGVWLGRRRRIADVVRAAREVAASTCVEQAATVGARLARRVTGAGGATVVLGGRVAGATGLHPDARRPTSSHAIPNRLGPPGRLVLVGVQRPVDRATRQLVTALAELIGETSDRAVAADSSARGAALTARRIEPRDAVLLVEVQTSEVEEQLGARMGVLTEALRPVDQVTVEDGIVVVVARDARPSTERVRERILAGWIASGGRGRLLVRDASAPTTDTETAT